MFCLRNESYFLDLETVPAKIKPLNVNKPKRPFGSGVEGATTEGTVSVPDIPYIANKKLESIPILKLPAIHDCPVDIPDRFAIPRTGCGLLVPNSSFSLPNPSKFVPVQTFVKPNGGVRSTTLSFSVRSICTNIDPSHKSALLLATLLPSIK